MTAISISASVFFVLFKEAARLLISEKLKTYTEKELHYGAMNSICNRINQIETILKKLQNVHIKSMYYHFKDAMAIYMTHKTITPYIIEEFKLANTDAIKAFYLTDDAEQNIFITKVRIVSLLFILHNDIKALESSVNLAIDELINLDKIQTSINDLCTPQWWHCNKNERLHFVEQIRSLVIQTKHLLSGLKKSPSMCSKEDIEEKVNMKFDFTDHLVEMLFLFSTTKTPTLLFNSTSDLTQTYKYHFLFMEKIIFPLNSNIAVLLKFLMIN